MKNGLHFIKVFIFTLFVFTCKAQNFLNGDLEGTVTNNSVLPANWQNVPFTDINCQANIAGFDSPDLTDISGPQPSAGILGNPYSGLTFISGMYGGVITGDFSQEGIMQNVSGLEINRVYNINFHQSVVKQDNALDESGSWAVYIDSALAGVTSSTHSAAPYNSTSFIWESRNITFTAIATSHLIKFLPVDDDTNTNYSTTDTAGALRMGIDALNLNIVPDTVLNDALIPTVFTPNNDGLNDVFTIKIKDAVTLNCKIYDRWGILVNELIKINEVWDGNTTSGLQCTAGAYYYIAEYTDSKGAKNIMKGFIQLLR